MGSYDGVLKGGWEASCLEGDYRLCNKFCTNARTSFDEET